MPDAIDLVQQLRAHVESLRAAGVLFVPRGAPLAHAPLRVAATPAAAPVEAAPEVEDPSESRQRELDVLRDAVAGCGACSELFATRTQTVFGAGPLDPEVAFVGDAPGTAEDERGEPFVGAGGQLLGRIIAACGFTRESTYLFNLIKCRPPKNRTPAADECANCRAFFDRQFDLVKPRHLVALGPFASRVLTGIPAGRLRGTVHTYRGVPLVCTHHPDQIERDATDKTKRETWDDMKLLLGVIGRPVPPPK